MSLTWLQLLIICELPFFGMFRPVSDLECPTPEDPINGDSTVYLTPTGKKIALFACNRGYTLVGKASILCVRGEWVAQDPYCVPENKTECPSLSSPINGQVETDGYQIGSIANYSCKLGYVQYGQSLRLCQENFQWSGSEPYCRVAAICPSLSTPINGQVLVRQTKAGHVAVYSCDEGYRLEGESTRKCFSLGVWSRSAPVCVHEAPAVCQNLRNPDNGKVNIYETSVGFLAVYSCNYGYALKGDSGRECIRGEYWSGSSPVCEKTVYHNPEKVHHYKPPENWSEKNHSCIFPHQTQLNSTLPIIYMITPTYKRLTQKSDLTKLCYTLMQVPNLHWIVIEDSEQKTDLVSKLLSGCYSCKIQYSTHLNILSPPKTILEHIFPQYNKPHRGVAQRNIALTWLRESDLEGQLKNNGSGVVYFGDDDNVYDLRLFEEMRYTKKVSVWLVGLAGGLKYEGPICENGTVVNWHSLYRERTFMIDMAGFAINLNLLLSNPEVSFKMSTAKGHLEDSILQQLVTQDELEPKADNCSTVLVWHVKTITPTLYEEVLEKRGDPSDPNIEVL